MLRKFYLLFLVFTLGVISAQNGLSQSLTQIIDLHIAAIGGAEKLANLQSLRTVESSSENGMEVLSTTTIVKDQGFLFESTVQEKTFYFGSNKEKAWMIDPVFANSKAMVLPDEIAKSLMSGTDITGIVSYREKKYQMKLDGEEDLAGSKVYKITTNIDDGYTHIDYVSKETYYVIKVVDMTKNKGIQETWRSDFREVDGIIFPFSKEHSSSESPGKISVNKVHSIEVNPEIDLNIFVVPK